MILLSLIAAAGAAELVVDGPASLATRRLAMEQVGFRPAAEDRPAMGPELYAAGPDGAAGLYDPARREVLVVRGEDLARVPVPRLDDLAFTPDGGLLFYDEAARVLTLAGADGELIDGLSLPGLVPPGCRLLVDGDQVRAVDVFGNRHRLAALDGDGLADGEGPALIEDPAPLTWDPAARVISWSGGELALPDAIKAGARWLSPQGGGWLVVDAVVGDSPLVVERTALNTDTGQRVRVPLGDGAWRPGRQLAAGPDGALLVLLPGDEALEIAEVRP